MHFAQKIERESDKLKGTSSFCVRFQKIVEGGRTQAIIKNLNLKKLKGS